MPQIAKGARLYLYKRKRRPAVYIIRDGSHWISTRCGRTDRREAEKRLAEYLGQKFRPNTKERDLARIQIAEVLAMYGNDLPQTSPSRALVGYHIANLLRFWGDKTLADVKGSTCRSYLRVRETSSNFMGRIGVSPSTVRRELKTLQASINHWHKESPLVAVPRVTLPEEGARRERFLERNEAAALIRSARRLGYEHVVRFILIGLYTGTRHAAILGLRWLPSIRGGHVDLERGILYRRGAAEQETKKRRPPVRIPKRLARFLSAWRLRDERQGQVSIIHWQGVPLLKIRRAWSAVVKRARLEPDVTPHVLRHTFCTWELWKGRTIWEVAGDAGMTAAELERIYGHHRNPETVAKPVARRA
jgi:integrase